MVWRLQFKGKNENFKCVEIVDYFKCKLKYTLYLLCTNEWIIIGEVAQFDIIYPLYNKISYILEWLLSNIQKASLLILYLTTGSMMLKYFDNLKFWKLFRNGIHIPLQFYSLDKTNFLQSHFDAQQEYFCLKCSAKVGKR